MRHLSEETLARLVDEAATEAEESHLRSCPTCAGLLRELREQTDALAALPALRPPKDDWNRLEARLRRNGLVGGGERPRKGGKAASPSADRMPVRILGSSWLQAAAALVLFLGGTAFGAWLEPAGEGPAAADDGAVATTVPVSGDATDPNGMLAAGRGVSSVDEAADRLRSAEAEYVDALVTYRELLGDTGAGSTDGVEDPAARFAALETLVAASQEAIRHAPADPFFNGVLASTMAERRAAIRQISTADDDSWF